VIYNDATTTMTYELCGFYPFLVVTNAPENSYVFLINALLKIVIQFLIDIIRFLTDLSDTTIIYISYIILLYYTMNILYNICRCHRSVSYI
jgi:hypothetical protein